MQPYFLDSTVKSKYLIRLTKSMATSFAMITNPDMGCKIMLFFPRGKCYFDLLVGVVRDSSSAGQGMT